MTVLSKQYSLVDLINLRLRDKDNFNLVNSGALGISNNNLVYNSIYDMANCNPLMSFNEFEDYMNTKNRMWGVSI